MTVNAITDTKKGRTGIAPTYLHTTPGPNSQIRCVSIRGLSVVFLWDPNPKWIPVVRTNS